jgi:hypothetical protein
MCRGYRDCFHASYCLDGFAICAVALDRAEQVTRMFASAKALRAALVDGQPVLAFPIQRDERDLVVAVARAALGEPTFAAAWIAGSALSLDEATEEVSRLALQVTTPAPATVGTAE